MSGRKAVSLGLSAVYGAIAFSAISTPQMYVGEEHYPLFSAGSAYLFILVLIPSIALFMNFALDKGFRHAWNSALLVSGICAAISIFNIFYSLYIDTDSKSLPFLISFMLFSGSFIITAAVNDWVDTPSNDELKEVQQILRRGKAWK